MKHEKNPDKQVDSDTPSTHTVRDPNKSVNVRFQFPLDESLTELVPPNTNAKTTYQPFDAPLEAALKEMLDFTRPMDELESILERLSPNRRYLSAITLKPAHVVGIMKKYLENNLSADDVEAWANLVEAQTDFLKYDESRETDLRKSIYCLANPVLTRELTPDIAQKIVESYS